MNVVYCSRDWRLRVKLNFTERSRLRWTHIHPDHWSTVEVASWLNFVADEHRIPLDERTDMLDAFDSVTGSQLLFMTKEQFVAADQTRGGQIFEIFRNVYPAGMYCC